MTQNSKRSSTADAKLASGAYRHQPPSIVQPSTCRFTRPDSKGRNPSRHSSFLMFSFDLCRPHPCFCIGLSQPIATVRRFIPHKAKVQVSVGCLVP